MKHVFLALLASGRTHGYELKRRYDALFAAVWGPVNIGQIYVTLGRLESDGLVVQERGRPGRRPDRKDYELTERGRAALRGWLAERRRCRCRSRTSCSSWSARPCSAPTTPGHLIGEHRQRCFQALRDLDARHRRHARRLRRRRPGPRAPPCTSRPSCSGSTTATTCWPVAPYASRPDPIPGEPHDDTPRTPADGHGRDQVLRHRHPRGRGRPRSVDLEVDAGEWVAIMGPSGCGKSTLLHLLGGLDTPDAVGLARRHSLAGHSRDAIGRCCAAPGGLRVPGLQPRSRPGRRRERRDRGPARRQGRREARRGRPRCWTSSGSRRWPGAAVNELSGGEQQRVALARAMVNDPPLLLADEPTGALDTESARGVLALLRQAHDRGQTIVMVTHDHRVAAAADRVLVMQDGRSATSAVDAERQPVLADLVPAGAVMGATMHLVVRGIRRRG